MEHELLQNQYYQREIDAKNRELTSNTMMVIEKNKMREDVVERLLNDSEAGKIDKRTELELKSQIRSHTTQDDEWIYFRLRFEQVHPDFFIRLKERTPSLTEGELRICAYIRTGMENRQITQMLSQQPDTIRKYRYRLRKKLQIDAGESLEDFLRRV